MALFKKYARSWAPVPEIVIHYYWDDSPEFAFKQAPWCEHSCCISCCIFLHNCSLPLGDLELVSLVILENNELKEREVPINSRSELEVNLLTLLSIVFLI